jgi:septum formation protein
MKIILASKSGVRKKILEKNNISCNVVPSNIDEDQVKDSLLAVGADPILISKNLAELKSTKVSNKYSDELVLGADSVISLNNELINKPKTREEALETLKKLNGSIHYLITSVCISKNGAMIWNFTDKSELKMKKLSEKQLTDYLKKIKTEILLAYGVYQIEAGGLELFDTIKGDRNSIMGLPIKQVIDYIKQTQ